MSKLKAVGTYWEDGLTYKIIATHADSIMILTTGGNTYQLSLFGCRNDKQLTEDEWLIKCLD